MIEITHYILGNSMTVIQLQSAQQNVHVNPSENIPVQVDGQGMCMFSSNILHNLTFSKC